MSLLQNSNAILGAAVDNFYDHQVSKSFRWGEAGYLKRTPSSAGNRQTWTLSLWVKKTANSYQHIINAGTSGHQSSRLRMYWYDNKLYSSSAEANFNISTALYRDPSAWQHIVGKLTGGTFYHYVNGVEVSSYSVSGDVAINNNVEHTLGISGDYDTANKFTGYMAEVVFIDGTALNPTSFASEKNGVWIPDDVSGLTYGSQGYYLDFADASAPGNDVSGNNNDWTNVNLATHDQMLDTPTFGASNGGNYANYLGKLLRASGYSFTMSEGNLKHSGTSGSNAHNMYSNMGVTSGKWYAEFLIQDDGDEEYVGIASSEAVSFDNSGDFANSSGPGAMSYLSTGNKRQNGTNTSSGYDTYTTGDIISVAMDVDNTKVYFAKNGTWQESGNPATASYPAYTNWETAGGVSSAYESWHFATCIQNNGSIIANFGSDGSFSGEKTAQGNKDSSNTGNFYYAPPSGFLSLNAKNLPISSAIDPAETDDNYPQKLFGSLRYTGNNGTRTFDAGFQIDVLFARMWQYSQNWYVYDTSRGLFGSSSNNYYIRTDVNGVEAQGPQYNWNSQSGSNYTLTGGTWFNSGGAGYQNWFWKLNGGTTSSGSGDLTSTHQVDPSGAFSIVKAVGDGGSGDKTVSHGLSKAPTCILAKNRDTAFNWDTYWATGLTSGYGLRLNETDAQLSGRWGTVNSSIFTCKYNYTWLDTDNFVYYCFTNIDGYCKAGVYSGTGRADGGFCYTGFEPAFLFVRAVSSGNDWVQFDNVSDSDNPADHAMYMNSNTAQTSGSSFTIDILSNGWKVRTTNGELNADTADMVYLAFAKQPLKYAVAR